MARQTVTLSLIEDSPVELPEEVQRTGLETTKILWQSAKAIAQQEVDKIRQRYQQQEADILKQQQIAVDQLAQAKADIIALRATVDNLTRENKALHVDNDRQTAELRSTHDHVARLEEKQLQHEHEIKHLSEELGRSRESCEQVNKKVFEINRQAEQDQHSLRELQAEASLNNNTRERLEKSLKQALEESEQASKQLRVEQSKVAVAEAITQELRELSKRLDTEIKTLREEKHEIKASLEAEIKLRAELEKKLAIQNARSDGQEAAHREILNKLEQDLNATKAETMMLRTRLIKSEGALEREKKAIERLETKLVASGNGAKF